MCVKSERNTALQCGVCYKLKQLLKLHLKCRHAFPAVQIEITGKQIKRPRNTKKRIDKTVNSNAKSLLSAYSQTIDSVASLEPINDVKIEVDFDSCLDLQPANQSRISLIAPEVSKQKSQKNKTRVKPSKTKLTGPSKRTVTDTKSKSEINSPKGKERKVTKNTGNNNRSSTKNKTTKTAIILDTPKVLSENKTSISPSLNTYQGNENKEIWGETPDLEIESNSTLENIPSETTSNNQGASPDSTDDNVSNNQESSPKDCKESTTSITYIDCNGQQSGRKKEEQQTTSTELAETACPYQINEDGFYNCRFCPSFFASVAGVRRHESCHVKRGEIEKLPETNITEKRPPVKYSTTQNKKSTRDKGEKPFSCSICGVRYAGKVQLERHEKRHNEEAKKKGISLEKLKSELMEELDNRRSEFPFECNKCGKGFRKKSNLSIHKKIHMQNLICPVCKHVCHYKGMFKQHMRKHQTLKCSISDCEEVFRTIRRLNVHISRDHGDAKPMTCHCGEQLLGEWALRKHQLSTHGLVTYTCEECGDSFKDSKKYKKHVGEHRAVRDPTGAVLHYACPACNKTAKTPILLVRHMKTHQTRSRPFACDVCDARFYTALVLRRHRVIHGEKTNICDICGKGFVTDKGLRSHMRTHVPIKSYVCPQCQQGFTTSTHLRAHELTHVTPLLHVCHVCGKTYKWEVSLKLHMKSHHSGDENKFACELCDYRTKLRANLMAHHAVHREPTHMCHVCGHKFKSKSGLNNHSRTHAPTEPRFACEVCDKTFLQKRSLTEHMLVHSDKKDVPCIYCDAMFKSRCSLPKHYRTQHPDRPYPIPPRKRYKVISKTSDAQPSNDEPTQATNITTEEQDTQI